MKNKITDLEIYGRFVAKRLDFMERNDIGVIHQYHMSGMEWIENTYQKIKRNVKNYLYGLLSNGRIGYFSQSADAETLYSYVYFVMLAGLLDIHLEANIRKQIIEKIKCAQCSDGLFYDNTVLNYQYLNGDGWGARHFIPHVIIALERLHEKPDYELSFLKPFMDCKGMRSVIEALDWQHVWGTSNFVMNIGVCMQYARDFMEQDCYNDSIKAVQDWLCSNVREDNGMWYRGSTINKKTGYEIIRGAYHLYPLLIYDGVDFPYKERAIDLLLQMQNPFGGFDFRKNSGACEDIDAIEPLIRLGILCKGYRENDIKDVICRAFFWVAQNQMEDGGFVYRRGERFLYGHKNMSCNVNESNLFATWFRYLSIEYMYEYLAEKENLLIRVPGYEYPLAWGRK